jgi:hypothetical protein
MDKNTKIILGVVAAVVVVCVCGACATLAIFATVIPALTTRAVTQNFPEIQIDPDAFQIEPGEPLQVNPGELLEGLEQMFTEDPQEIEQLSDEIVEFDLPAGYEPAYGMDFMLMKMAGFEANNPDKHILAIQFPPEAEIDIGKMMLQMREGNVWGPHGWGWGKGWWDLDTKEVDRYLMTIRGQEVPVIVSEGGDSSGFPNRSAVTAFEGQNGPVLFVVTSDRDAWDQAEVDALLDSIR